MHLFFVNAVTIVACVVGSVQPSQAFEVGAHVGARIELAVDAPQSCLKYFPKVRKQPARAVQEWTFIVDSKERAVVRIQPKKGPEYDFDCEFVGMTFDPNSGFLKDRFKDREIYSYSLAMHGKPSSLEDALQQAGAICRAYGISDRVFTKWHAEKKYKDVLSRTVTNSGKLPRGEIAVDIRSSLEQQRPWCVTCELNFNEEKR